MVCNCVAVRPSLKHQRVQDDKKKSFNTIAEWYKKGVNEKARATKFRKGACANCGAMTHKAKNCLDVSWCYVMFKYIILDIVYCGTKNSSYLYGIIFWWD